MRQYADEAIDQLDGAAQIDPTRELDQLRAKRVETFSGATKDLSVVDNGDGTITVRTAITGVAQEVTLSGGTVAIKDLGRVVFATGLDYNGTPTDTSDDEFISQTIESISGPHPNLESDFTLFCEVVVPALT
jgi:hypothetical protein